MSPYNPDMIKRMIMDALETAPRGVQTRLATATGVRVQTVNKWAKGQTSPDPAKWSAIEDFFGWKPGRIARAAIGEVPIVTQLELPDGSVVEFDGGLMMNVGDTGYILLELDAEDPLVARVRSMLPENTDERLAALETKVAQLQEALENGDENVVPLTQRPDGSGRQRKATLIADDDAGRLAAKSGDVAGAREVSKAATLARKTPARPKPPVDPD